MTKINLTAFINLEGINDSLIINKTFRLSYSLEIRKKMRYKRFDYEFFIVVILTNITI